MQAYSPNRHQEEDSPPVFAVNVPSAGPPSVPLCKQESSEEVLNVAFVTVKSDLSILSTKKIVKESCSTELTWLEFFRTFQIFITHPDNYYILGKGGRTAQLEKPVIEFVKTFDRPLQLYVVSLEPKSRPVAAVEEAPARRVRTKPAKLQYTNPVQPRHTRKRLAIARNRPGPLCSKLSKVVPPVVLLQNDIRSPQEKKAASPKVEISTPSPPTMQNLPTAQVFKTTECSQEHSVQGFENNNLIVSVTSAPQSNSTFAAGGYRETIQWINAPQPPGRPLASNGIPTTKLSDQGSLSEFVSVPHNLNDSVTSNGSSIMRNESFSSPVQDGGIKQHAMNFLQHKVSNQNMMTVHDEIMRLKQSGDYFQLTLKAPLAAGLLEQLLCPPVMYLGKTTHDPTC